MGRQSHSKFKFQYLNLRQMFAGRKSNLLYNFLCHVLNEKKTFKKSSVQFLTRMNIKYMCFISITSQSELTFISHVLFYEIHASVIGAWIDVYQLYLYVSVCCLKISRPWTGTVFECFTHELNIIMTQENIHMQACMRKRIISRAITLG